MRTRFERRCWALAGVILTVAIAGCSGEAAAPAVSSCNKVQASGMCTEYRGYPAEEARIGCYGGTFTEAACPRTVGGLVGSCEKHLSSVGGTERIQVDFYYTPVRPPHTPETLRNLCQNGTWSSGG